MGDDGSIHTPSTQAMSEDQLKAFMEAVKADAGLQEQLKAAGDTDAAVAMAKEAGFDVSKADWLRYQAKQTLELSDEELEGVAGGGAGAGAGGNGGLFYGGNGGAGTAIQRSGLGGFHH